MEKEFQELENQNQESASLADLNPYGNNILLDHCNVIVNGVNEVNRRLRNNYDNTFLTTGKFSSGIRVLSNGVMGGIGHNVSEDIIFNLGKESDNFSLDFWIKMTNDGRVGVNFAHNNGVGYRFQAVLETFKDSNNGTIMIKSATENIHSVTLSNFVTGNFRYVAIMKNNRNFTIYVDGNKISSFSHGLFANDGDTIKFIRVEGHQIDSSLKPKTGSVDIDELYVTTNLRWTGGSTISVPTAPYTV